MESEKRIWAQKTKPKTRVKRKVNLAKKRYTEKTISRAEDVPMWGSLPPISIRFVKTKKIALFYFSETIFG